MNLKAETWQLTNKDSRHTNVLFFIALLSDANAACYYFFDV